MSMKYDQQRRFNKLNTEEFYLLDHTSCNRETQFYEFTISGSTRSVYTVKLYTTGKTFCTCPDFVGHAARAGCVCKHVCFVFARVLKYPDPDLEFYETLTFDYPKMQELCRCFTLDSSVVNMSLTDKYIDLKENKPKFDKYRAIQADDECPICYTELSENILGCPACLGAVHIKCMEKWLTNKKTCCYCRNPVWERYNEIGVLQL